MNILINTIKKKLQSAFKYVGYKLYISIYGKIFGVIESTNTDKIIVTKISFAEKLFYRIFFIKDCRIYTDTVADTAFIINNKIIDGPSFQHRNINRENADCIKNIVFIKGTPRKLKKIKGSIFSLLTGGAGNHNYFHWIYDVLPRLGIIENKYNLNQINFFLFPDIKKKFQIETLDFLQIPIEKRLSSLQYRHVKADSIFAVDHPYVVTNDPSSNIQNIPLWILRWLKEKFVKDLKIDKNLPRKFYIDRKDSVSGTSHLRKIINENEVKEFLKKRNYEIINLGELSFVEQVALFKNAKEIVGLHGAGFANVSFCDPQTNILELKPTSAGDMYKNLSINNKLAYKDISIKPEKNRVIGQFGHIVIPIESLKDKIN